MSSAITAAFPSTERAVTESLPRKRKFNAESACGQRPNALRKVEWASETIQKIGSLSASHQFQPWTGFSCSGVMKRPHPPIRELTEGLQGVYESGRGSQSDSKIRRWSLASTTPLGSGTFGDVYPMKTIGIGQHAVGKANEPDPYEYKLACAEYQNLHEWRSIPHVVRLLGGADDPKMLQRVIIMERADPTLVQILEQYPKLPFQHVMSIFRQFLEMHQAASYRNLVHADLKPANVGYKKGNLTIFDLGLAHSLDKMRYRPNTIQSLHYRAPEIILGKEYDCSIDLWSIGCIIYEIFCGKRLITLEDVTPGDEKTGIRMALKEMGRKLGPPSAAYLSTTPFETEYFQRIGFQSLTEDIRNEADRRGLSPIERETFTALLSQILKFEDRIDPPAALKLCNEIVLQMDSRSQSELPESLR